MKNMMFIAFTLIAQIALASDNLKSDQMLDLFEKAGVESWGRKERMNAQLTCKYNRHQEYSCNIVSGVDEHRSTFKEYFGEEAIAVSALLKSFNILPQGKHHKQQAFFECHLAHPKLKRMKVCALIEIDYIF